LDYKKDAAGAGDFIERRAAERRRRQPMGARQMRQVGRPPMGAGQSEGGAGGAGGGSLGCGDRACVRGSAESSENFLIGGKRRQLTGVSPVSGIIVHNDFHTTF